MSGAGSITNLAGTQTLHYDETLWGVPSMEIIGAHAGLSASHIRTRSYRRRTNRGSSGCSSP